LSVKNTGRKPTNPRQNINLGPKSKLGDWPNGPEPGSDEFIMLTVSKRYESGIGWEDKDHPLCMGVTDGKPCIHSESRCPEHSDG